MKPKRDLLSVLDLTQEEVDRLLARAGELKALHRRGERHEPLRGKTLALVFEKSSTRTRTSFQVGMVQLGGAALDLTSSSTQLGRGETPEDTARVLGRFVEGMVVRTYAQEILEAMAGASAVPVINGLTDLLHPCQVLSDLFTIVERRGDYRGCTVAYVGDGNNMANSWVEAAAVLGLSLRIGCPSRYTPDERVLRRARERKQGGIEVLEDPARAVRGAEVVYTDVWVSMGQEKQRAARLKALRPYQVNAPLLAHAAPGAVVMHCLPAHRGEEISADVMDGPRSIVFDQAENRLHFQKALLEWLL